jgi:hypothetical protein
MPPRFDTPFDDFDSCFQHTVVLRSHRSERSLYFSARHTEDEAPAAVGQWSPWANAGLLLLAALISRYHHTWVHSIRTWIFGQKDAETKDKEALNVHHSRESKSFLQLLHATIRAPYQDLSTVVAEECWELVAFVKNPKARMAKTGDKSMRNNLAHEEVALEALPTISNAEFLMLTRKRSKTF